MGIKNLILGSTNVSDELIKIGKDKGWIKEEVIEKKASVNEKPIIRKLAASEDFDQNILTLVDYLNANNLSSVANETENLFVLCKKAETEQSINEEFIKEVHPEGSPKLKGVQGDGVVENILDQHLSMLKSIEPKKMNKSASKSTLCSQQELKKNFCEWKKELENLASLNLHRKLNVLENNKKEYLLLFLKNLKADLETLNIVCDRLDDSDNFISGFIDAKNIVDILFDQTPSKTKYNFVSLDQLKTLIKQNIAAYRKQAEVIENSDKNALANKTILNGLKKVFAYDKINDTEEIIELKKTLSIKLQTIKAIFDKVYIEKNLKNISFYNMGNLPRFIESSIKNPVMFNLIELNSQLEKDFNYLKPGIFFGANEKDWSTIKTYFSSMLSTSNQCIELRKQIDSLYKLEQNKKEMEDKEKTEKEISRATSEIEYSASPDKVPTSFVGTKFSNFHNIIYSTYNDIKSMSSKLRSLKDDFEDSSYVAASTFLNNMQQKLDQIFNNYNENTPEDPNDSSFETYIAKTNEIKNKLSSFKSKWGI